MQPDLGPEGAELTFGLNCVRFQRLFYDIFSYGYAIINNYKKETKNLATKVTGKTNQCNFSSQAADTS